MKSLLLLGFLLLAVHGQAQSELLVEQSLITDWSDYPIYPRLVEEQNGEERWKAQFAYLDSIEVYRISYMSDGLKINGLMAKPAQSGSFPCVIFNRGGNRDFGSLKVSHGAVHLGQLASEGYVVIASQYRGNGGSEGVEEFGGDDVNDILILPEVLSEIESADTSRIGMMGWSRGGMMTYLALTRTDRIKAAVVGGALADCHAMISDRTEMESGVMAELIPDYEKNKKEALDQRSAVQWANRFPKDVPILLMHGNADWRVKPEQSLNLALEFEKYRIPYRLVMFEGGDHGISEHRDEVNQQVVSWFDRFLKADEMLPEMEYHGK